MITVTKEVYIKGENPIISLSGVPEGSYDMVLVLQSRSKRKRRKAGFSKAKFIMSEDFNAPLDDFKDYM